MIKQIINLNTHMYILYIIYQFIYRYMVDQFFPIILIQENTLHICIHKHI